MAPPGPGVVGIKDRVKRIQAEVDRRTALITKLADAFNEAHDRARDEFFMKFVEVAVGISGAPQPDAAALDDDGRPTPGRKRPTEFDGRRTGWPASSPAGREARLRAPRSGLRQRMARSWLPLHSVLRRRVPRSPD